MTRLHFIILGIISGIASVLGLRRKNMVLEFRNHNFGGLVDFADDPMPRRFESGRDSKLQEVQFGDPRWKVARYEMRVAIRSRTPAVTAPCAILFARVESFPYEPCSLSVTKPTS